MKPKDNLSNRGVKRSGMTMAIIVQQVYQDVGAALATRWNSIFGYCPGIRGENSEHVRKKMRNIPEEEPTSNETAKAMRDATRIYAIKFFDAIGTVSG
jgi:hypothetical protein